MRRIWLVLPGALVIGLLAWLVGGGSHRAVVSTAAPWQVRDYVALGDSYVSGPGIPAQTGQPLGCRRSDHNYPALVNEALRPEAFRDVSCGGAKTTDLTNPQVTAVGTNDPQLNALTGDTDLVTLGIGANDLGTWDVLRTCTTLSSPRSAGTPCRDHYRAAGRDVIGLRLRATAAKVLAVLAEIDRRSPDAEVLVVGYPAVLPDSGPVCAFSAGDAAWLREGARAMNGMLATAAAKAGVTFVDTYRPSIGHDACQPTGVRWVEGYRATSAAAPGHPNATGMRATADAVLAAVRERSQRPPH